MLRLHPCPFARQFSQCASGTNTTFPLSLSFFGESSYFILPPVCAEQDRAQHHHHHSWCARCPHHHQPCLFRLVLALVHLDDLSRCLSICVCFCHSHTDLSHFSDCREIFRINQNITTRDCNERKQSIQNKQAAAAAATTSKQADTGGTREKQQSRFRINHRFNERLI